MTSNKEPAPSLASLLAKRKMAAKDDVDTGAKRDPTQPLQNATGAHSNDKLTYRQDVSIANTVKSTTPVTPSEQPKASRKARQLEVSQLDKKIEEINQKQAAKTNETIDTWKSFDSVNYPVGPQPAKQTPAAAAAPPEKQQRALSPVTEKPHVKNAEDTAAKPAKQEPSKKQPPREKHRSPSPKEPASRRADTPPKDRPRSKSPLKKEEARKKSPAQQKPAERQSSPPPKTKAVEKKPDTPPPPPPPREKSAKKQPVEKKPDPAPARQKSAERQPTPPPKKQPPVEKKPESPPPRKKSIEKPTTPPARRKSPEQPPPQKRAVERQATPPLPSHAKDIVEHRPSPLPRQRSIDRQAPSPPARRSKMESTSPLQRASVDQPPQRPKPPNRPTPVIENVIPFSVITSNPQSFEPTHNSPNFKLFPYIKPKEITVTRNACKSIQRSMDRYRFHVW